MKSSLNYSPKRFNLLALAVQLLGDPIIKKKDNYYEYTWTNVDWPNREPPEFRGWGEYIKVEQKFILREPLMPFLYDRMFAKGPIVTYKQCTLAEPIISSVRVGYEVEEITFDYSKQLIIIDGKSYKIKYA